MAIWRVTITLSSPVLGGTGTNTFHARTSSDLAPFDDELQECSDILGTLYGGMAFAIPNNTAIACDGVWTGVGPTDGEYSNTDPFTLQGENTGGSLPPANAIVASWRGASGDRSRRGRTFFGPIGQSIQDGSGTINDSLLGSIRSICGNAVTASQGLDGAALGVWSREESVFRDWVAVTVRDQFGVLRSRRD